MAEHVPNTPGALARPSRRALLSSTAALAVAASIPAAASTPSPDAELIAMAVRATEIQAEQEAICSPYYDCIDEWLTPAEQVRSRALVDEFHDLAFDLANAPARTVEGLRAKARAMMVYSTYDPVTEEANGQWWSNNDQLLGRSLAMDILAGRTPA